MSILIKDMKMPESCLNCPLETDYGTCGHFNGANYAKYQTEYNSRPVWCPLVELPPHGRLIDADTLLKPKNQHLDMMLTDDWYVTVRTIETAPTVLEAEAEE